MKKLAVLVGINYSGSQQPLQGSIKNVELMLQLIQQPRFGFELLDIQTLTDKPGSRVMPTGARIRRALEGMVENAKPGDVLLFCFSGHGTYIPAQDRPAIIPSDYNMITSAYFRELVDKLPEKATFTFIADTCHSGGLIDKEKEQIGPGSTTMSSKDMKSGMSYEDVLQHLASLSGMESRDIGKHLVKVFGDDASPEFLRPLGHRIRAPELVRADEGILVSACQKDEITHEVEVGGIVMGSLTYAIMKVLDEHKNKKWSNREIVVAARKVIAEQGFEHHPCLYCSDQNVDAPFLKMN